MGKFDKEKRIALVDAVLADAQLTPAEVAELVGMVRGTCKGYLDNLSDVLPPSNIRENGYRLYSAEVLKRLVLLVALKDRPGKLTNAEVRRVLQGRDTDVLWAKYKLSNEELRLEALSVLA